MSALSVTMTMCDVVILVVNAAGRKKICDVRSGRLIKALTTPTDPASLEGILLPQKYGSVSVRAANEALPGKESQLERYV